MLQINHIKKEIRVAGLQRSGNHAIINWIIKQSGPNVLFFNDIDPESPFDQDRLPASQKDRINDGTYDCVIYSYEDRLLNVINSKKYYPQNNIYNTTVDKRFNIIILRNPFNMFASRLKHNAVTSSMSTYISGLSLSELWITYAYEYIGKSSHMGCTTVAINYDLWCTSHKNRRDIAEFLELKFTDDGFNEITSYGQGSSFDKIRFDSEASKMVTNQRWKAFTDNPIYLNLFTDRLITELTKKIFSLDQQLEAFIDNKVRPRQTSLSSLRRRINIALLPQIIAIGRDSAVVQLVYNSIFQPIRKYIISKRI